MHDLSHDTVGIEQRLSRVDAVQLAFVDNDLVLEGIQVDRHQLGHQDLLTDLE